MAYYAGIYAGKHVVLIILLLILAEYLVQLTYECSRSGVFFHFICSMCNSKLFF